MESIKLMINAGTQITQIVTFQFNNPSKVASNRQTGYIRWQHTLLHYPEESNQKLSLASKLPTTRIYKFSKTVPRQRIETMAFYPLFATGRRSGRPNQTRRSPSSLTFSPRFDMREVNDSYLLDGEVSGICQSDIEIEFVRSNTLVIKGRIRRDYKDSVPQTASSSDLATSPESDQPTVKGESSAKLSPEEVSKESPPAFSTKYWVYERQVGKFKRKFTFRRKVDQDDVKANLKNGILSIVVPKAPVHTPKKIIID
jgi:HSP20 family molecular chaperone IbpA